MIQQTDASLFLPERYSLPPGFMFPYSKVAALVKLIQIRVNDRGYMLSRYENHANTPPYHLKVTWVVHHPPRTHNYADLRDKPFTVVLASREGKTTRCKAFDELMQLYDDLDKAIAKGLL